MAVLEYKKTGVSASNTKRMKNKSFIKPLLFDKMRTKGKMKNISSAGLIAVKKTSGMKSESSRFLKS